MRLSSLCISIIAIAGAVAGANARTAADFFTEAPASVLPLLSKNARLDMLDYYHNQLPTPTANELGGRARILDESADRLHIQLSRDSDAQIAVISTKIDTILAVIETVLTPVADSSVRFYSKDWELLTRQPEMPVASDFIAPGKRRAAKGLDADTPLYMRAEYHPADRAFVFINTTPAYYTNEQPALLRLMNSTIAMTFDGRNLKPLKDGKK